MNHNMRIEVGFDEDHQAIQPMIDFFADSFNSELVWREKQAGKAVDQAVRIIIQIIGTWAAERFLLDPLADKSSDWIAALKSYWRDSPRLRRLEITIKFNDNSTTFEFNVSETGDAKTLIDVWPRLIEILNAAKNLQETGFDISRIRMIPDGTSEYLVLGYLKNRPSYIYDLQNRKFGLININPSRSDEDLSVELWKLNVLIRRLDYHKAIKELGHEVSENELSSSSAEIDQIKETFQGNT